jgi:hypothetical protein
MTKTLFLLFLSLFLGLMGCAYGRFRPTHQPDRHGNGRTHRNTNYPPDKSYPSALPSKPNKHTFCNANTPITNANGYPI